MTAEDHPELAARLGQLFDQTSIIDPHTHIHCDQPSVASLSELLSYHWVQTELLAAGIPRADLGLHGGPEAQSERIARYLPRMRNTAIHWCVLRILNDLFGFEGSAVNESNVADVSELVRRRVGDYSWPTEVLNNRSHIQGFVTSLGNRGNGSSSVADRARFMLDAHYLFCPGVATDLEPFFNGRHQKLEYYEALSEVFGERPSSSERLETMLRDWLERTLQDKVRFSNTFIPIEQRFGAPDRTTLDPVLTRLARGDRDALPTESEVDEIAKAVTWSLLAWHHDQRKALQIAVGAEYFICDGKSIPRFQERWTSEMARVFHTFGNVRFDLMMASDVLSQEVAVLARQFPNVYTSGYWWHNFFPSSIERIFGLRIQATPMSKIGGFLSDAYSVEWAYAKLQLVKRAIIAASSKLIIDGYLNEDLMPDLLHEVLYETPKRLYELDDFES